MSSGLHLQQLHQTQEIELQPPVNQTAPSTSSILEMPTCMQSSAHQEECVLTAGPHGEL